MIEIDTSVCSGCRRCEVQCAFFHTKMTGRNAARIRIVKIESLGLDAPVLCRQCSERYCMQCPVDAISIGSFDEIIIDPDSCTGCGICARLCPVGAIEIFNDTAQVCDLCGGHPSCVAACSLGAIRWNPDKKGESLSNEFINGSIPDISQLNIEERRVNFARSHKTSRILKKSGSLI